MLQHIEVLETKTGNLVAFSHWDCPYRAKTYTKCVHNNTHKLYIPKHMNTQTICYYMRTCIDKVQTASALAAHSFLLSSVSSAHFLATVAFLSLKSAECHKRNIRLKMLVIS